MVIAEYKEAMVKGLKAWLRGLSVAFLLSFFYSQPKYVFILILSVFYSTLLFSRILSSLLYGYNDEIYDLALLARLPTYIIAPISITPFLILMNSTLPDLA